MLKVRLFAIALTVALFVAAPQAKASDPCDPAVLSQMSSSAQQGFNILSDVSVAFLRPPPPGASSNCLQSLLNVWSIDPMLLAAAIFPTGTLGYTIGGFTLTHSSPAALVLGIIQSYFNTKFGGMICGELWAGIGKALAPLQIQPDGSINIEKALTANFPGLSAAIGFLTGTGFSTTVEFPGGFTGSVNIK